MLALALVLACLPVQTIDFESIPNLRGGGAEGLAIRDQFDVAPYFVRFERLDASRVSRPMTLAMVGAPRAAFEGSKGRGCDGRKTDEDQPSGTVPFLPGCFFLTDDGLAGDRAPAIQSFVVRYSVPVLQASGYILDIDNHEEFTIQARDENDLEVGAPVVLTPRSGSGGNGDASFWFLDEREPIHSISFEFTGRGDSRGTAFDDFSTASACPGQVIHHGNGTPGTGNRIPAISITCPQVGREGSIEVFNGPGGAHGCLGITFDSNTRPLRCGTTLSTQLSHVSAHVLSGAPGTAGTGRISLRYKPLSAALAGATFYVQAAYIDPGACRSVAFTEILEATVR